MGLWILKKSGFRKVICVAVRELSQLQTMSTFLRFLFLISVSPAKKYGTAYKAACLFGSRKTHSKMMVRILTPRWAFLKTRIYPFI